MQEKMSLKAFLASGSLEAAERKRKGILILSIQDLYKDLDRRRFLLGSRSPFPNGFMKVSKRELHSSTSKELEKVQAHYKDLQNKLMNIQLDHWKICFVWYVETSKTEWKIREFGRRIRETADRMACRKPQEVAA